MKVQSESLHDTVPSRRNFAPLVGMYHAFVILAALYGFTYLMFW